MLFLILNVNFNKKKKVGYIYRDLIGFKKLFDWND